jgi:Tol biopolymer transport system component
VAYPTGAGEPKVFPKDGVSVFSAIFVPPDGKQLLISGSEEGHGSRLYLRDFSGGKPRALSPEGYSTLGVTSADGKWTVVRGPDRKRYLYPIAGGEPIAIPGVEPDDSIFQRSVDGRFLYVAHRGETPSKIHRLEIATGRKEFWRSLMPADGSGVNGVSPFPTPSGEAYVYNYIRTLSDLYLVEGVR